MQENANLLLQASGIDKSFGENHVLLSAGLEIRRGEVMALLGENGAGKSTMVKIITGVYKRDGGDILFDGASFPLDYDKEYAQKQGISIIYQELSAIPTLTVAQNIFLGNEPLKKNKLIDYKKMYADARALIGQYGFDLDPEAYAEDLSIAKKQLVEIVKALSRDCKLMIMDEPTASLSEKEVKQLFEIISSLKARGISILYISHRLKEVYQISDRITILRDGREVAVLTREEIDPDRIVNLMIGHELSSAGYDNSVLTKKDGPCILEVKNLSSRGKFEDVSFQLRAGEVLGIAGLVGAGRSEMVRAIFGADPFDSGKVYLHGKKYSPSLKNALKNGFAYVPEDRRIQGIIPEIDVARNIGVTNFDQTRDAFGISRIKEMKLARKMIDTVKIMPADPHYRLINMSGGNQQKVVVGKWLARDLKVFICDEPTSGVDVGAKEEIYQIIEGLCAQGVGVILVSSDLPEITRLADRILVLHKGRVVKEFKECAITEEDVLKAASGFTDENEGGRAG